MPWRSILRSPAVRGACCLCLLAHASAGGVQAQESTALNWVREPGAEACIPPRALARSIENQIGPVLVSSSEGKVLVEGRIGPDGGGFSAHVAITRGDGEVLGRRTLHSAAADCRAIDPQLVFVIVVAIDPDAALAELPGSLAPLPGNDPGAELLADLEQNPPTPVKPPKAPAEAPASAGESADRSEPEPPPEALPWRYGVSALAAFSLGKAPSAALGPQLALSVEAPTLWPIALRASYYLPAEAAIGATPYAVRLSTLSLSLALCPALVERRPLRVGLCAGPTTDRLAASARGFSGRSQVRWLAGVAASAEVALELGGPVWVELSLFAQSQWPKHAVVYGVGADTTAIAHTVPALGGGLALGLGAHL